MEIATTKIMNHLKSDTPLLGTVADDNVIAYDPDFDRDFTERLLGRGEGDVTRSTTDRVDQLWEEAAAIIRPRLTCTVLPIERIDQGRVVLEGGHAFASRKMAFSLRHAGEAVLFLATIGGRIDRRIDELQEDNHLADSYVLDAIGSGAVEHLADRFQRDLAMQLAGKEKAVGLRFSPGYCDWPVHEQHKVFACLDAEAVGVALSDTALMDPRKSISGLFGIFNQADRPGHEPQNPCRMCAKKDCIARRAEQPPTIQ